MPIQKADVSTPAFIIPLARALSLPHELAQSILSLIINFEPWTYSSPTERTNTSLVNEDLTLLRRDEKPFTMVSMHHNILGLSSRGDWLTLVLSRHPHHLSRRDKAGVSSAVTQALRRMNARIERLHWDSIGSTASLERPKNHEMDRPQYFMPNNLQSEAHIEKAVSPGAENTPMRQYQATVQLEEDVYSFEDSPTLGRSVKKVEHASSPSTSIIKLNPTPILKLGQLEIIHLANQCDMRKATEDMTALLVAVLIALTQCRLSLLEVLEKLKRDTAILSIEPFEARDFATPKCGPRHGRMRSLSGSTVAEFIPHETPLSLSAISTACNTGDRPKQSKLAEKSATDEDEEETSNSPKRPKLSEYKQVSSGRVANLMDRFEKFHL